MVINSKVSDGQSTSQTQLQHAYQSIRDGWQDERCLATDLERPHGAQSLGGRAHFSPRDACTCYVMPYPASGVLFAFAASASRIVRPSAPPETRSATCSISNS